jgi:hypothetical protein
MAKRPLALMIFLLSCSAEAARAATVPPDLIGVWADNPACGADGITVAFTAGSMEVAQDGDRRSLVDVDARRGPANEVELRTVRVEFVRQPNAAPPSPGDVLRFRREGNVLRLMAVTMQGKPITLPPDGAMFHRCRR